MLGPLLLFAALIQGSVGVRHFLSANSFSVDDITARASVRISMGGYLCSGTLISSNIVYTAAHCVHDFALSSIGVYHSSAPTVRYQAKAIYVPEQYKQGSNFAEKLSSSSIDTFCRTAQCSNACVKNAHMMEHYYSHFDYGLILLETPLPICVPTVPTSPVAATIGYPSMSQNGFSYVPADRKRECFVAGYGTTDKGSAGTINLAIIRKFDGFSNSDCGVTKAKGVFTHFWNSSKDNGYETSICKGDSGSGIQCLSNGGKTIQVLGINIETWARKYSTSKDSISLCREPHDSFTLSAYDHVNDVNNAIWRWKEMDNLWMAQTKCETFLQKQPYNSVMLNYLNKAPEFR